MEYDFNLKFILNKLWEVLFLYVFIRLYVFIFVYEFFNFR